MLNFGHFLVFKKHKERSKIPEKTPTRAFEKDDSFIVDDDVIELNSDEDDDEKAFSPSFYLKVLNDKRRRYVGINYLSSSHCSI